MHVRGSPSKGITDASKDVEKRELSCTVGRTANCYSHYGKTVWRCLRKLKIELTHDLAFPLQGIYLRKQNTVSKDYSSIIYSPKTWKQPKCPAMDKVVMTHNTHMVDLKSKSYVFKFFIF